MSCLSSNFMIFFKSHELKQKAYSDFTHDSLEYVFDFISKKHNFNYKFSSNYSINYLSKFSRKFICVYVFGVV